MRDYADEENLHARIYALRSRLLSFQDYTALAHGQGGPFSDEIANSDPVAAKETIFRAQIAPVIPLIEASRKYAPLFLAFLRQFEALNAKLILSKAFGLKALEQWHDIGPYAVLGRDLLRQPVSLDAVRPLLAGTYLAGIFAGEENYGEMEVRAGLAAARDLYSASALFTPEGKTDFQKLMGRRVAVTTTVLRLRLKKNYNWDDEKIRAFLERRYDDLGISDWPKASIREQSPAETPEKSPGKSPVDAEHFLEQYYYNWISAMFRRDFHSVFSVVCYLWLLFYQVRNLFKIIEGRGFGLSPEGIVSGIICEGKA